MLSAQHSTVTLSMHDVVQVGHEGDGGLSEYMVTGDTGTRIRFRHVSTELLSDAVRLNMLNEARYS